ncbi:MAG: AraC family transcriptional regulator [Gammaproteobacteria bacterium]|nr:AraC family transcriptional regulator [Gammaproteobacteria bacterium]
MSDDHDPASGTLALPSESLPDTAPQPTTAQGDPLSDVLRTVKLNAAVYFLIDASTPYCVDIPHTDAYRSILQAGAGHMMSYHVIVEGGGVAAVPGGEPIEYAAGDVIVFPQGDGYKMGTAADTPPEFNAEQTMGFFRALAAGTLPFVIPEGGGGSPKTKVICGFMGCDPGPFNPLLAHLPRLLRVRWAGSGLLDRLIDLTMAEVHAGRTGADIIRLGLSELMFLETLRHHINTSETEEKSWLAALRDPVTARALTALHQAPSQHWTLASLASESATSRSVLAERFTAHTGLAPMQYLTRWRLQLAARRLADSNARVSAIAHDVGYSSEAAFSRGFKKLTGQSPTAWRRGQRLS